MHYLGACRRQRTPSACLSGSLGSRARACGKGWQSIVTNIRRRLYGTGTIWRWNGTWYAEKREDEMMRGMTRVGMGVRASASTLTRRCCALWLRRLVRGVSCRRLVPRFRPNMRGRLLPKGARFSGLVVGSDHASLGACILKEQGSHLGLDRSQERRVCWHCRTTNPPPHPPTHPHKCQSALPNHEPRHLGSDAMQHTNGRASSRLPARSNEGTTKIVRHLASSSSMSNAKGQRRCLVSSHLMRSDTPRDPTESADLQLCKVFWQG